MITDGDPRHPVGRQSHPRVCAIALNALEVYAVATPWLHQDTTTITLYGAYEEEARPVKGLVPPRPAYGHSKMGMMISSRCS